MRVLSDTEERNPFLKESLGSTGPLRSFKAAIQTFLAVEHMEEKFLAKLVSRRMLVQVASYSDVCPVEIL